MDTFKIIRKIMQEPDGWELLVHYLKIKYPPLEYVLTQKVKYFSLGFCTSFMLNTIHRLIEQYE